MNEFIVHPQLINDCEHLGELDVCQVLLMRDERFPWLILVPTVPELRDLHEIPPELRVKLFDEIELASKAVGEYCNASKINVAALGNMVPQLHIHVIGRRTDDAGWPAPVWSAGPAIALRGEPLTNRVEELRSRLFN